MSRPGMILVLVLLAVLALELLAMSAFGFARVAQLGARTAYLDAQLRMIAEDAAVQAVANLDVDALRARPVGAEWEAAPAEEPRDVDVRVRLRRLPHGFVHTRAEAARSGLGRAAAAAIVRTLEPGALLEAFPAVLSTRVPPLPVPDVTPAGPTVCAPYASLAPALLPAYAHLAFEDSLPLGRALALGWDAVDAIADADAVRTDSAASPQLAVMRGPVAFAGSFDGILAVDGDLVLESTAVFHGLLVVRGALRLRAGARVRGAVRAGLLADEGGSLAWDRCAAEAALTAPALRRVYRAGPRWRLPAF